MTTSFRLVLLASLLGIAACSGDELTRTFGLTRDAPDEFQVTTRAPLSMPPDFTLRPPRPGAARPQELTQQQQAEAALSPDTLTANTQAPPTPGQQALVAAAGRAAPADIRARVDREAALDRPSQSFADRLMFWKPTPPAGTVVDPVRESQRLRENAALGQTPDTGDTPIIQRRSSGNWFTNLF